MPDSLSPRELNVLELAAQGLTDKLIAAELGISAPTVMTYWRRIREKLGSNSRAELVAKIEQYRAQTELNFLRKEIAGRIASEESLRQDAGMLRELMAAAPEAMIAVGTDGVILKANELAADLLECPRGSLVGMRVGTFVPPEVDSIHKIYRDQYFKSPTRLSMGHDETGVDVITLAGKRIRCILTLNMAELNGYQAAVVIMRAFTVPATKLGEPVRVARSRRKPLA